MATVYEVIKDRTEIFHADAGDSVLEVVRLMVKRNIGAVPVLREGEIAGIFSERDLMKRIVAEGRDASSTAVGEVMTPDPLVVSPDEDLDRCLVLMRQHGFRHLPICEGRQLKGLVSLRDLLMREVVEKVGEVEMMRAYIRQS